MKMFRAAFIVRYRGNLRTCWKAIVLAESEQQALEKAKAEYRYPQDDGHWTVHQVDDVYNYG